MTDERLQLSITLPLDPHQCGRLRCPHCGLDFKVDLSGQLQDDLLAAEVSRIMQQSGLKSDSDDPNDSVQSLICVYCAHRTRAQEFVHDEHSEYIQHLLLREYIEPMMHRMFDSTLGDLRSTKYMKFETWSSPRSPRPIAGPESGDMVRIRCLSCRTLFKVVPYWRGDVHCTECGIDLRPF